MRWFSFTLPFVVAGAAATAQSSDHGAVVERDVVVIGGGSSGTYAAIRLQEEGHSVVVLEKEDQLGGHTVTYTDPDTDLPFNMGVIVYHDSPIVRNYFGSLGVAVRKAGFGGGQGFYDFSTGRSVPGYKPVATEAFAAATQKFAKIFQDKYPYLSLGYDVPDPVPEELLAPYAQFIETNGLGDVVQQANNFAGCNGNLLERPTLYGLKAFSPLLLKAIADGFINAASGDNHDLYSAAQRRLESSQSVVLRSRIKKVKRSDRGVQVWIKTPEGNVLVKAKKLVLAIPPTIESLKSIGLDLTSKEKHLFKKFDSFLYGSTVFTHDGLDANKNYVNVGADTPFNLLKLPGSFNFAPLASGNITTDKTSAYFCSLDPSMPEDDIKGLVKGELDNLAREGNIGEGEPDFLYFSNHAPFHIHVSPKDILDGFYKKLYALEGQKSTFWTGAAFVDNDSALIWTWTESYLLQLILDSLEESST